MLQPPEDQRYFEARIERELAMASSAQHPQAARAHAILAQLYLERLGAAADATLCHDYRS